MKSHISFTIRLAALGMLASLGLSVSAEDDLGKIFKDTGWNRILGTWVQEGGETTFSWKYEGKVLQAIAKQGENEITTLLVAHPKTREVFVSSVTSLGGSSRGTVKFQSDSAEFNITAVMPDGFEVKSKAIYKLVGDDTLEVDTGERTMKLTRK